MNLNDKVIWITGASSGIGEAFLLLALSRGAKVIASARNKDRLIHLLNNVDQKEHLHILPLDITELDRIQDNVEVAYKKWGRIDILVNNAGVSQRAFAAETDTKIVKKILETNFLGPVALTRYVIPLMKAQQSGHCVFVSSLAGKIATPLRSSYSASKMAIQGFADSLRAEVYRDNITITLVIPGFVKTNISLNALMGEGRAYNTMDPNQVKGISPKAAAKAMARGIEKNKREVYCGLAAKGWFALLISHYFPGLFSKIIRKAKVT